MRLCGSLCPSAVLIMIEHICSNAVCEMGYWPVVLMGELQGVVEKLNIRGLGLCRHCETALGLCASRPTEVTDDDNLVDLSGDELCSEANVDAHGVRSATVIDALIFVKAAETGL